MTEKKFYFGRAIMVLMACFLFSGGLILNSAANSQDSAKRVQKVAKDKAAITTREDENNYYYELNFSGPNKEDIMVSVKNGLLTFSISTTNKNSSATSASSFNYSTPVPEYDSSKELEITRQERKITVKLSKKQSNQI